MRRIRHSSTLLWMLALAAPSAGAADLNGIWVLNVEASSWGPMRKPASVVLDIEQKQNSLRYSGVVVYASDDSRDFEFTGVIDGKPYPVTRSWGPGTVAFRRTDSQTLASVYRSNDGLYEENAKTVLLGSGKRLIRYLHLRCPEGDKRWVEIYDRR
jgi:hypothetical protein